MEQAITCPTCKHPAPAHAKFCPSCGALLQKPASAKTEARPDAKRNTFRKIIVRLLYGAVVGLFVGFMIGLLLPMIAPEATIVVAPFVDCPHVTYPVSYNDEAPPPVQCTYPTGEQKDIFEALWRNFGILSLLLCTLAGIAWSIAGRFGPHAQNIRQWALLVALVIGWVGATAYAIVTGAWNRFIGSFFTLGPLTIFAWAFIFRLSGGGARSAWLQEHGIRGKARITAITETGMFVNNRPEMDFSLIVTLPNRPDFEARARSVIGFDQISDIHVGGTLSIRANPENPTDVVFEAAEI